MTWWKSKDLMKRWVLNLLCLSVLASPHSACTCLCFWAKAQCTVIPALLKLSTDSPFSLAVRSSPALAPAPAAVKQEGKEEAMCVTAVLLRPCPPGCGAAAPEHCMFLWEDVDLKLCHIPCSPFPFFPSWSRTVSVTKRLDSFRFQAWAARLLRTCLLLPGRAWHRPGHMVPFLSHLLSGTEWLLLFAWTN